TPSLGPCDNSTLALSEVAKLSVTTSGKIRLIGLRSSVPPSKSTRTLPSSLVSTVHPDIGKFAIAAIKIKAVTDDKFVFNLKSEIIDGDFMQIAGRLIKK